VLRAALRDASLTGAIPCLLGWDACLAPEQAGGAGLAELLMLIDRHPQIVIIAGQSPWQARGSQRQRHLIWLDFPVPDYAHRLTLWSHFIGQCGVVAPADLDLVDLAGQFSLTAAQIHDAVATAADQSRLRDASLDNHELFVAARSYSSPGLANLAHKIDARYTWDDIVLPTDQLAMLKEIIATVRGRPLVLETWGVGEKLAASAGVTILFAGPPGTGKTMAAEVVASELGLELYKIDLSTVVNKYIGETEKNLGRIFDEASNSNAILFFDEADAIFGKRSEVKDAHDRYANIEVSYLLQRMETYDGVTVLATNLRANLDDAFTRRLQFAVDFPFPDETYRLRIWQSLFPPGLPRAPNLDLPLLARRFKLAGGNIRNIIVSAAYLAAADGAVVTMPHLLHGARRELQKMGRLLKEKELE
jgi:SpoVK/Ycf46/Vps4 family AAA+-type ATPase